MRKIALFILSVIGFTYLQAQQKNEFNFSFNHQALSVKDLQRSASFYSEVLGLQEINNRTKIEGIRWYSFGEGKELHLISILPGEVIMTKAVHLALSTPRFDDFIKHLDSAHITYTDWPGKINTVNLRADGVKQIYFQDPDGYWIEINSSTIK